MQEEWRTVVINDEVYDNYEVSNFGQVRSLKYRHTNEIKILQPCKSVEGYLKVNIYKHGKRKSINVHILVALAFIQNDDTEHKTQVNHIDENKVNNHVTNLEWTTPKENSNHGTRTERSSKNRMGSKNGSSKKVVCVETGRVYETMKQAAEKLGLNRHNISQCCRGCQKTCGGFHWEYYNERD